MRVLNINPEFQSLIPPLSEEEFNQLEQNIVSDGFIRDPIVLWKNTQEIVDGHNRYRIAQAHPEIPFDTISMDFDCKEEAIEWICLNQLGRRNINDIQKTILVGMAHEARKAIGWQADRVRDEHGHYVSSDKPRTRETIAGEKGVTEHFVKDSGRFVRGLNEVEAAYPGTFEKVNRGEIEVTKKDVMAITSMPDEKKPEALKAIAEGKRIPKDYIDTPIATAPEHTSEYDIDDFRSELSRKVTALEKGLELTVILTHKDIMETEEGKEALRDTLLEMTEVIKKYLEFC